MVRRMIAGDEEAFETFADSYIPALHRFALFRLNRDTELTRDIVQSTVVKVISKLRTWRGEAALMTWICATCRTEIAMHFRRANRFPREVEWQEDQPETATFFSPNPEPSPERVFLDSETNELVHIALDLLPTHYGRALEWKYLQDIPVKEIGNRLNLSPKAAESLLTRARNSFRDMYTRVLADPEMRSVAVADGMES